MLNWFKKYFIPHEGNSYKPHLLRHETITFFLLLTIAVELGFLIQVYVIFDKTNFLAAVLPGVLTDLTNEARAENNLPPLKENQFLVEAAERKVSDMTSKGYFAHVSPEGVTPWHWLQVVGYSYAAAGENLAVNFNESEDVTEAWMNSPTHRANIVRADFEEIGIAVARGKFEGKDAIFVAQFFGKPFKVSSAPAAQSAPVPENPAPPPASPQRNPIPEPTRVLGEEETPSPTETQPTLAPKPVGTVSQEIKTSVERAITSPGRSVNTLYIVLALIIFLALLLAIFIRIEIQHPVFLARGVLLFAIIAFLLFANIKFFNPEPLIPADMSANVIYVHR